MVFVYNGCQKPVDDDQTFYLVLVYLRTILDASQVYRVCVGVCVCVCV